MFGVTIIKLYAFIEPRNSVKKNTLYMSVQILLQVYSGYRFVDRAASLKKNIAIVNIGTTRADNLAHLKISARCGDILPHVSVSRNT